MNGVEFGTFTLFEGITTSEFQVRAANKFSGDEFEPCAIGVINPTRGGMIAGNEQLNRDSHIEIFVMGDQ